MTDLLLVGTDDGFRIVGRDSPGLPPGQRITAAAVDDQAIWAVGNDTTIWHHPHDGGGEPFASIPRGVANCILPVEDGLLVGADRARLFHVTEGRVERVEGFDRTPGRDTWHTPWGGPPDVRSLALGLEGTIYVNVHVGGVVVAPAIDSSWRDTMNIGNDVHEVVADATRPGTAYAAAAVGLGTTHDAGETWRFDGEGLYGSYSRAVAHSAHTLFASASGGPRGQHAAVYRRPLESDDPFERCSGGLPDWFSGNIDTACLAATGTTVAIGEPDGTVYISTDDGDSWEIAESGYPGLHCLLFVAAD